MAEDRSDAPEAEGEERPRTGIRRRLGRLLNQRELAEDTSSVFTGVLEMSDRAKTEAVRLVAREARNYLDELKIKEDILELITSHSLELQLSVHLKPLADAARDAASPEPEPPAKPKRAKKSAKAKKAAKAEPEELEEEEVLDEMPPVEVEEEAEQTAEADEESEAE